MLIDVRNLRDGQPCAILGCGRSILDDRQRYTNIEFLRAGLSVEGRRTLYRDLAQGVPLSEAELERRADEKFISATGITARYVFAGCLSDLATLAATDALHRAGIEADAVDAILVGTNTADEYNIANGVKRRIGASVGAYANTMMAACPVGANVVFHGWQMVRLGLAQRVLVIGAERATTLASPDQYRAANLFGDAAFCFVLGPGTTESFSFFAYASDPYDGKESWIRKADDGFEQDGPAVHKYVGTVLPNELQRVYSELSLDPARIDHLFPHQASSKTNDLFDKTLRRRWQAFRGRTHGNVVEMGNTSAASTGWLIARAAADGDLRPGQFCLVVTFGAGMSWGFYGFIV